MRKVLVFLVVLGAVIAAACNFIVENKFKEYGTTCQFKNIETQCGQCIARSCGALIDQVCQPKTDAAGFSTALSHAEQCAGDFDQASTSDCDTYYRDAGALAQGTDPFAVVSQLRNCIKSKCIGDSGATACRACKLQHTELGTTQSLESNPCGKCLRERCGNEIVNCCSDSIVSTNVEACAFWGKTDPPPTTCMKVFEIPSRDGGRGDAALDCDWDVPTCANDNCKAECKAP